MLRVVDLDVVPRRADAPVDREPGPRRRNARLHRERTAVPLEAEDAFDAGAIHPARRPGVPGPATTARVFGVRVDVAVHHVWLGDVALDARGIAGVVDGIDHVEQLHDLVAVPHPRHGHDRPDRGVRVLSAVLADPWHIALDVARILLRRDRRRASAAAGRAHRGGRGAREPRPSPVVPGRRAPRPTARPRTG